MRRAADWKARSIPGAGRDEWLYPGPAGAFDPNGFWLYDITGNVWE